MNVPDSAGGDVTTSISVQPRGQTSTVTSFADVAPDATALWPVIAAVGVCTAVALTLIVLGSVALARSGR